MDVLKDGISDISYEDLLYFAGFIDGEGCISCAFTPYVKVAHTYLPVLEDLRRTFGGSISDHTDKSHKKKAWLWRVCGDDALNVLVNLRPHLREKQRQADIAIEIFSMRTGRGRKTSTEILDKKLELIKELSLCKTC